MSDGRNPGQSKQKERIDVQRQSTKSFSPSVLLRLPQTLTQGLHYEGSGVCTGSYVKASRPCKECFGVLY